MYYNDTITPQLKHIPFSLNLLWGSWKDVTYIALYILFVLLTKLIIEKKDFATPSHVLVFECFLNIFCSQASSSQQIPKKSLVSNSRILTSVHCLGEYESDPFIWLEFIRKWRILRKIFWYRSWQSFYPKQNLIFIYHASTPCEPIAPENGSY